MHKHTSCLFSGSSEILGPIFVSPIIIFTSLALFLTRPSHVDTLPHMHEEKPQFYLQGQKSISRLFS